MEDSSESEPEGAGPERVPRVPSEHGDGGGLPATQEEAEMSVRKRRKETCVVCGPTHRRVFRIPQSNPKRGFWIQGRENESELVR